MIAQTLHEAAVLLVERAAVTDPRVVAMSRIEPGRWTPVLVATAVPTLSLYSATLQMLGFDPIRLTAPAAVVGPPPTGPATAPAATQQTPEPAPQPRPTPRERAQQRAEVAASPLVYDHTIDGLRGIPVTELSCVGPVLGPRFVKYGIATLYDLLTHVPLKYVARHDVRKLREWEVGEEATIIGTVTSSVRSHVGGRRAAKISVEDGSAMCSLTFFNAAWMADGFSAGDEVVIVGKLREWIDNRGVQHLQMSSPLIARTGSETLPLVPVYPQSTKHSLTTWQLHRATTEAVSRMGELADPIPGEVVTGGPHLMGRADAYRTVHTPRAVGDEEKARQRLAYDELLRMSLALRMRRLAARSHPGVVHRVTNVLTTQLIRSLAFPLTGAQRRVLSEIAADMRAPGPMNRLLQGEVGSGKTLVALCALLMAVEGGHQAALMAPTGTLATQHALELQERLAGVTKADGTPLRVELMTGGKSKRARLLREALAAGEVDIVVSTHAVIEEGVTFARLGLAVVDEQHRFGVDQRAQLSGKGPGGAQVDVLVMTATPIPRTAQLTVFGDLDTSVIDELPAGRVPRQTSWTAAPVTFDDPSDPVWSLVREQVAAGRQAYVVCPLVEDSETKAAASVLSTRAALQAGALAGLSIGTATGKMKTDELDAELARFKAGELDVLVATTVIEVGVNVPNASVIVLLDPSNFGVAQLHQLRGRVGRGSHASYCVLAGEARNEDTANRLEALVNTDDGFVLSEVDLQLRGHGALMGSRQHGMSDLRVANLTRDAALLQMALADADALLRDDPELMRRPGLRAEVANAIGEDAEKYLTAS